VGGRTSISEYPEQYGVPEHPQTDLVEAAANGDQSSFSLLCGRYYPTLVAIAHSIIGDGHLAEDAAQQALAAAAGRLPQLREKSRFAAWVAAICRNEARDLLARRRPMLRIESAEGVAGDDGQSDGDDRVEAVRQALRVLPDETREVVYLRYYEAMTYEHISAVLGLSEQAINGRLRRAKKTIAEHLRRQGYGGAP